MMANHLSSYTFGLKYNRIHTCHSTSDLLVGGRGTGNGDHGLKFHWSLLM